MATNPVPQPLAPSAGLWYPTPPHDTPTWLKQALRRAFDSIYQMQGQLLPSGAFNVGSGTIKVPLAPAWNALTNCAITLPRAGLWTFFGTVTFDIKNSGDINFVFLVSLLVSGLAASTPSTTIAKPSAIQSGMPQALVQSQPTQITVAGVWQTRVIANARAVLQVQKDKHADAGVHSLADCANSMIAGVWCGT
jgi:hypothetical protein